MAQQPTNLCGVLRSAISGSALRRASFVFTISFALLSNLLSPGPGLAEPGTEPAPPADAEQPGPAEARPLPDLALAPAPYSAALTAGRITDPELAELSGLTRSIRRPDLLWAVNDSGNEPYLYALGLDGASLGKVRIDGAENVDWEDLASFTINDKPYLAIADIGDNEAVRDTVTMYMIEEPVVSGDRIPDRTRSYVAWRVDFTYPDSPRNAEAAAVDPFRQSILIVTKHEERAELFDVPLFTSPNSVTRTARARTVVAGIPTPTDEDLREDPKFGAMRSQVTAMDIAPDRTALTLLTYKAAYRYERRPLDDWRRALGRAPQVIELPRLNQAEALAYAGPGDSIFVTSEQIPAPFLRFAPRAPGVPAPAKAKTADPKTAP